MESSASPEHEKQDGHDQEDHNGSRPNKKATPAAISADHYASRGQQKKI